MGMAATADSFDAPIMEMNTTPLIDVLLVLLIMFIITIPLQTHAVNLDLSTAPPKVHLDEAKNKIVIDDAGAILWNGTNIDLRTLTATLERTQRLVPIPELHLQPTPAARYERVDEVLAVTKRVGVEKMGFVGNEQYRAF